MCNVYVWVIFKRYKFFEGRQENQKTISHKSIHSNDEILYELQIQCGMLTRPDIKPSNRYILYQHKCKMCPHVF